VYNDVSVNENMHLATAFKILRRPGNDLWEHLSPDQFRFFRRTVIQIVLATDMAGHSELLQVNSLTFCDFFLSLLVKFAFRHPAAGLLPNPIITAVATYRVAFACQAVAAVQCWLGHAKHRQVCSHL